MSNAGNVFGFLDRPPRSLKPRRRGLTVASDRGLSHDQVRSAIEANGDIIDHAKMTDHVGLMWRCQEDWLRRKIALYADAGIDTLPGGVPFEVAVVNGKVPAFMARVADLGFKAVEVSEDSLDLGPGDRLAAIRCGVDVGLHVYTEVGKKLPEKPLDPVAVIDTAQADLDAGAYLVVIEKSDVALCIGQGSDAIHRIVEGVGLDKVIVECGPGDDRFAIAKWLIGEFGSEINLENIGVDEAMIVEGMRHGLHRAIDYSYFHPYKG